MKPPRIVRCALLVLATLGGSACGLGQAIHDGTVNVAKRTFTRPMPTMNLDVINRGGDTDPAQAGSSCAGATPIARRPGLISGPK